ncbi:MAG: ATP-binding protein [Pegethrix bostrychoides GSE-TBD4-15B]|jgi:hypothetical protein|uniref:ATP-binding protein n=1 Tax=Pegethrix bostrychoides GSE-TBD4-15B TaxID=2839662 RepID=A0A951U5Z1_9CYAN|nr:ATP-binding protein [Pegethrix bostrychoides GSE-TBD4-15B]
MQFNASVQFLQRQTAALLLYQAVMQGEAGQAFLRLLAALQPEDLNPLNCLLAYGQWFQALVTTGLSWQDYLLVQLLRTETALTRQPSPSAALTAAAQQDLRALQHLYSWTGKQLSQWVQEKSGLEVMPVVWETAPEQATLQELSQQPIWSKLKQTEDWAALLPELVAFYRQMGTGLFAAYGAFRWQAGQLIGISHPDPIRLDDLVEYESQKATLQQNTEALLAGYPALHMLLYGGRGTGKSSLVKALLSTYRQQGLRLIEVSKADLHELPQIVDQLRHLPQKFVIFVDDLSFEADNDAYKALKVVLEGNMTARPQNMVLYATSNRRHLIREFFGDRPRPSDADEIHAFDTVQEKLSFSDRFGLTLTFEPANQETYLAIIRHLAQQASLPLQPEQLEDRALTWATRHNGRSGRTARQFVDFLQAELRLASPN